jgi:hypothetical protein
MTRIGAPWTKEEEDTILAHVASGLHIAEIAVAQKRTSGGIRARLTRIACQLVEQKMSVFEAAGRTGIRAVRVQEALKRKTEQEEAKKECLKPKMEFKFQQTFTRAKLQGRAEEMRKAAEAAKLWQRQQNIEGYVNQTERIVLDEAAAGKFFYLYEVRILPHDCTNEDILQGFRQKFPECTVTLAEEWVDVPNRHPGQPPTRILKSGIKIDWS